MGGPLSRSLSSDGSSGGSGNAAAFTYNNGRRYHAVPEAPYILPNDDEEMNR